jgi:exopolyphosphatase / guanosine-5'-triphosphate,3'-diphosphate pyrophosphatase
MFFQSQEEVAVAVIDLGTNTSNLVIADLSGRKIQILCQSKEYVRLGDQRISENVISDEAIARALAAVDRQIRTAKEWKAHNVRIIATSAVRHAKNKEFFSAAIYEHTGIEPEIIDGDREATLIYYGVKLALGSLERPSAILDIGGGSNEIIVCENGTVNWKGSFPAGMSRVINSFSLSDPITEEEIIRLEAWFTELHSEAMQSCRTFGVDTLIGCSGAFNTLADLIEEVNPEERFRSIKEITVPEFYRIYRHIVASTHEDRKFMKGIDPVRTDLIVPALILTRIFIESIPVSRILQTGYALREGVLFEMFNS